MSKVVTWDSIEETLESHDYPGDLIAKVGGMPQNSAFHYVSDSFLSGIINYTKNHVAYLVNRYGMPVNHPWIPQELKNIEDVNEKYRRAAELLENETHFKPPRFDDCIIFGESESTFYIFYYDGDNSDCSMYRVRKSDWPDITYEQFIQLYIDDWLKRESRYHNEKHLAVKINRKHFGWIG